MPASKHVHGQDAEAMDGGGGSSNGGYDYSPLNMVRRSNLDRLQVGALRRGGVTIGSHPFKPPRLN